MNEKLGLRPTRTAKDVESPMPIDKGLDKNLTTTVVDDIFRPTPEMRRVKAEFYNKVRGMGLDVNTVDVERIQSMVPGCTQLLSWWRNHEFISWFRNAEEHRVRVRCLLDKHLDNIENILTNVSGEYSVRDQLTAGKQLIDMNNVFVAEDKNGADAVAMLKASPEQIRQLAAEMLEKKRNEERKRLAKSMPAPLLPVGESSDLGK